MMNQLLYSDLNVFYQYAIPRFFKKRILSVSLSFNVYSEKESDKCKNPNLILNPLL